MSRKSLGREFLTLGKYNMLTVVTLFLRKRENIKDVVTVLDRYYENYRRARVYFAYQLLTERRDRQLTFEIVLAYDNYDLSHIFKCIQYCILVRIQPIILVTLYTRLLNSSFRVFKKLLFDRLKVGDTETIALGTNLFTRMVQIDRNVLSMRDVGFQEETLLDLHYDVRYSKESQRKTALFRDQAILQKKIFGETLKEQQIHIPILKREALLLRIQARECQMRDCQSDPIIPQQQQLTMLVSALQIGLQIQL